MRIIYHVEAQVELLRIVEYYEQEGGVEIADRFVLEVRQYIEAVAERFESFPEHAKSIRRTNMDRFPYHLLFRKIDDDTLKIIAIKHNRRKPSLGMRRR